MRHHFNILALLALVSSATAQFAPITTVGVNRMAKKPLHSRVYVDPSATGANNGSSWDNALTDLQSALSGTIRGEIWVAEGTYFAGPSGDQFATFQLRSGIEIYGGFTGSETRLDQRDVAANPTILSGDIDQNDVYGSGLNWWQVSWNGNAGNSFHIVTGTGADATAALDGFTILAGRGDDPALLGGAGLLVEGGSPTIRNCTFRYNALGYGSSAYLSDCNSVFENCVIRDAYTCNCGAGGRTSGIICTGVSNVTFLGCEFSNHYFVSNNYGQGAALSIDFNCVGTLVDCRFTGNQTGNFYPIGGGTAYGAGVYAAGDVFIDRCEFVDNFAHAGAGVTAWGNVIITNSLFARNRVVSHPNGSGFNDGGYGGGFLTVGFGSHTVEVTNCTFVENNADKGAGFAIYGTSTAIVSNTIAYYNFAAPPDPGEDPVFILKQQSVGSFDISNSCVEGLLQTEPGEDPPDPKNFPGCIDTAPGLIGLASGDYQLQFGSPGIDSGDNTASDSIAALDLNRNPRFIDDPSTPDTGIGLAPVIDMGCYEFSSALASGANSLQFSVNKESLSISRRGATTFFLRAGVKYAGMRYRILGSTASMVDGPTAISSHVDPYITYTTGHETCGPLGGGTGILDVRGEANARLVLPVDSSPQLAGLGLRHEFVVLSPAGEIVLVSNSVMIQLVR